ncbi:MAG: response regulator transcription factor [Bacteroidia bacterium]|nr:response regulator transcription factor [Bacteroidia bacterium]
MTRILLVEDEANFGAVLRDYLQMNQFDVTLCKDGEEGLKAFRTEAFRLIILDVMMPKKDGFTVAEEIRKINSDIPIIFLTARSMQEDVVKGFQMGGDDYITKPFHSEELLLRIKAVLKRTESQSTEVEEVPDEFSFGMFHFNYRLHTIKDGSELHKLSPKEADLLRLLLIHKNDLLPREKALQALWGDDNYFNARSMDVFISKLRKRFKPDPRIKIENVHSRGFRLVVGE